MFGNGGGRVLHPERQTHFAPHREADLQRSRRTHGSPGNTGRYLRTVVITAVGARRVAGHIGHGSSKLIGFHRGHAGLHRLPRQQAGEQQDEYAGDVHVSVTNALSETESMPARMPKPARS